MRHLMMGLFVGALHSLITAQRVWRVDQQIGRGDFTTIQAAVDVATDGDVILVRPGARAYAAFRITGKGLVVAADAATRISIESASGIAMSQGMIVTNTTATQSVIVRGFSYRALFNVYPGGAPLIVDQCRGAVTIEDCGLNATGGNPGAAGAFVTASDHATLIRCELMAAHFQCTAYAMPGLHVENANVHLHDCTVVATTSVCTAHGFNAVDLRGGTLTAAGTTFRGGRGRDAPLGLCVAAGNGGHAVHVVSGTAILRTCALVPGPAGNQPNQGCQPGQPGSRIAGAGRVMELIGSAGSLLTASPVRYGSNADFAFQGMPNDLVWLALAPTRSALFVPSCGGTLHPDLASAAVLPLGLTLNGALMLRVPVPALSVDALALVAQAGFLHTVGGCSLSAPTELLLVHPRF
jgi:hypothetical protein